MDRGREPARGVKIVVHPGPGLRPLIAAGDAESRGLWPRGRLRSILRRVHFRVRHESLYCYDVPVALGPHRLRLIPRADGIRLRSQRLDLDPLPAVSRRDVDALGNEITHVEFNGTTQRLHVVSEFELDTLPLPPLDVRLAPLPSAGGAPSDPSGAPHPAVRRFAESVAEEVRRVPVAFLDHLAHTLYTRMERHIRATGVARLAHETLELGSGACRDLTILFLEACRSVGLEGRFVSGYQAHADTPDGRRHLHAWAEVLLRGVGWRGWDAMHGVRVSEGHVALCAAPSQADTMPIEGSFSFEGAVVNSTLDHAICIAAD